MKVIDFTPAHVEQATQIAKQNYEEERGHVPALPPVEAVPDLTTYVENNLGVAALESDRLVGFLCAIGPFENAFRSTDATGVFSPMGANGAAIENRAEIYAGMYQVAGEKWVRAGATSHAVCLYAHDKETQKQFFRYGFGLRCIDAIREMDEIASPSHDDYCFSKVTFENASIVLPLENMLHRSYLASPFFMPRSELSETRWLEYWEESKPYCFAATYRDQPIAFIIAELESENFIQDTAEYQHITGLYCLPEHRGKGISQSLLNLMIRDLKERGYTRLGVDFESINPSGSGFWQKYFTAYTHSVVRRIDEYAVSPART